MSRRGELNAEDRAFLQRVSASLNDLGLPATHQKDCVKAVGFLETAYPIYLAEVRDGNPPQELLKAIFVNRALTVYALMQLREPIRLLSMLREMIPFVPSREEYCLKSAVSLAWATTWPAAAQHVPGWVHRPLTALCAEQAVFQLREAIRLGFTDFMQLRTEPSFAPLRERADFQALLRAE